MEQSCNPTTDCNPYGPSASHAVLQQRNQPQTVSLNTGTVVAPGAMSDGNLTPFVPLPGNLYDVEREEQGVSEGQKPSDHHGNNEKTEEGDNFNDEAEDHDAKDDEGGEEESVQSDEGEEGSEDGEGEEDLPKDIRTCLDTLSTLCKQSHSMVRHNPDGSYTESFCQLLEKIETECDYMDGYDWWELDVDQRSTAIERLLESGVIDLLCDVIAKGLVSHNLTSSDSTITRSPLGVAMNILAYTFIDDVGDIINPELWGRVRDDGRLLPVLLETLRDWYRPHMDNTATAPQNVILTRSLEIIHNTAQLDDTVTADRLCQLGTTDVLGKYLQSADDHNIRNAALTLSYIMKSGVIDLLRDVIVKGLGSHNRTSSDYTTTHSPLGAMYVLADTFSDTSRHRELWCRVRDDGRLLRVLLETLKDWYRPHMDKTATAPQNKILTRSLKIIYNTAQLDDTDTADRLCQLGTIDELGKYLKSAVEYKMLYAAGTLGVIVRGEKEAGRLTSAKGFCDTLCGVIRRGGAAELLTRNTYIRRALARDGTVVSAWMKNVRQTDKWEKLDYLHVLSHVCDQSMAPSIKGELLALAVSEYSSNTGTDRQSGLCRIATRNILKALRDDLEKWPKYRRLCIELGFQPQDGGTGGRKRKRRPSQADDSTSDAVPGPSHAEEETEGLMPKAGVYTQAVARKHGMIPLTKGMDAYLYKPQLQVAMQKSKLGDKSKRPYDGSRLGRRLLAIFFSKEERKRGSIAEQPKVGLVRLDKTITEAIIMRCLQEDPTTTRGKVRDAMASSLSAERVIRGKKAATRTEETQD